MKLNRKIEYALMAIKHMSQKSPGELTTAKEISEIYGSPIDATAKVLQRMTRYELLKSVQGVQGGYLIQKDLSRLSLHEFNEMILGRTAMVKCLPSGHTPCEIQNRCNILGPINLLNEKLVNFYKSISVKELLEPRKSLPPNRFKLEELYS